MQSPLANLSSVLETVKKSASNYESTLMKNEAATRAVLIDPVLHALGWDIANPFKVEVETTESFGKNTISADYALKANGEVVVIVEAKRMGTNLQQFHHQLVQYGFAFKIEELFLTDGIRWEHFASLQPGNLAPTKTLDLNSDDLGSLAAYLVQELDVALISPDEEQIGALTDQVEQLQQEIKNLGSSLEPRVEALEKAGSKHELQVPLNTSTNLTAPALPWQILQSVSDPKGKKPSKFRLPDGKEVAVKTWGQVLVEACRHTLNMRPDLPMPLLDKAGKKTSLIQTMSYPPNVGSKQVEVDGRAYYVYTNYSASHCVSNAIYVLDKVPKSIEVVEPAIVYS